MVHSEAVSISMQLHTIDGENKMITGGLKCPFMAQKILKQNGEIESINICMYQHSNYGYHRDWPI